jgi:hypothetical protein
VQVCADAVSVQHMMQANKARSMSYSESDWM